MATSGDVPLAFDRNGEPVEVPTTAVAMRVRRASQHGRGGAPSVVWRDGALTLAEAVKRSPLVIFVGARSSVGGGVYFVGPTIEATRIGSPLTMEAAVDAAVRHAATGGDVHLQASGAARHGDYHAIHNRLVEMGVRFSEKPVR